MAGSDVAARQPKARLRLTGAGGMAILTAFFIALAAANTANNLLYLMLGLLVATGPVSAWLSRRSVAALRGEMVAPRDARRGVATEVVAAASADAHGAPGIVLELHARERGQARFSPTARACLPFIGRGAAASASLPAVLARRGPAQVRLMARSPFPFGLMEGQRLLDEAEILVLPDPDPDWRRAVPPSASEGEPAPRRGDGTEIFNIRAYVHGDDARHVDWKATARVGRPMLREHAREQQQRATIVVAPSPRPAATPAPAEDARFEDAIRKAAGAVQDLAREGWRLRIVAPGVDVQGGERELVRVLARLDAASAPPAGWWRACVDPGETVLDLSPGAAP